MITHEKTQNELQHDMNNVGDLLKDNRCRVWRKASGIQWRKRPLCLKVCSLRVSISGNEGDDRGHRKGPKEPSKQRWSVCIKAGETGKVEVVKAGWGESGRVGGQGGSGADVSRAEDGRASRKDAVQSMPLLQPGAGRRGEENRDKIKLQARSAHSPAAARTANTLTNR